VHFHLACVSIDSPYKEYFAGQNRRLAFARLPILAAWGKAAIPLEMLSIVSGQPYLGVIPDSEKQTMLSESSKKPQQRLEHLQNNRQVYLFNWLFFYLPLTIP
jgi:hypothetical protein